MRYYHDDIEYIGAKVRIDDKLVDFEDQFPLVINGRTLIPVRAVAEILGAAVNWNQDYYQVEIEREGVNIILPVNYNTAYIGITPIELDVPAQIINDRTMVPLRFIAEAFEISVIWEEDTRTVIIGEKQEKQVEETALTE